MLLSGVSELAASLLFHFGAIVLSKIRVASTQALRYRDSQSDNGDGS